LVTCSNDSIILHNSGCNIKEIHKFCQYHELIAKKNCTSHPKKITKLEQELKRFTSKEMKHFNKVKNNILDGSIRKSKRNNAKTMAKINESIQYERHEQALADLERICGEKVVSPFLLNNPKLAEVVENERQNLDVWDDLDGCRGKQQMEKSKNETLFNKTGGIQSWMTHSGFILSLHEHIHLETPTAVILSLVNALLATEMHKEYAKRVMTIGYDMMCTIYGRMKNLLQEDFLPTETKNLLISLLSCLHVDKFHVASHRNPLCKKDGNMFSPYAEKFATFFGGKGNSNDQIVEQNWRITNKLRWAKSLGRRRFNFMLYDLKNRHNSQN